MTALLHLKSTFNTVAPEVAACTVAAHVWDYADSMMRRKVHIICVNRALFSLSFLAVFCINMKSYFSLLTSKGKFGRAREKRDTRDCVRVKQIKREKWGAARRRRQWGKYWDQIFPLFSAGLNTFCPCFIFELWRYKDFQYSIIHWLLLLPPKPVWQAFRFLSKQLFLCYHYHFLCHFIINNMKMVFGRLSLCLKPV